MKTVKIIIGFIVVIAIAMAITKPSWEKHRETTENYLINVFDYIEWKYNDDWDDTDSGFKKFVIRLMFLPSQMDYRVMKKELLESIKTAPIKKHDYFIFNVGYFEYDYNPYFDSYFGDSNVHVVIKTYGLFGKVFIKDSCFPFPNL